MVFTNVLSWFEIPTMDLNRAQRFYETIFEMTMIPLDNPGIQMRIFPVRHPSGVGGALVYNEAHYKPSGFEGPLLYLNADPDVEHVLSKVAGAGGTVLIPTTQISPEYGTMAVFIDTEGNRIALHSSPGEADDIQSS